jgi:hypothetical protein
MLPSRDRLERAGAGSPVHEVLVKDRHAGIMIQSLKLGGEGERILQPGARKARLAVVDFGVDEEGDPPEQWICARCWVRVTDDQKQKFLNRLNYSFSAWLEG